MVAPVIQRQGGLSPKPPLFDYDSWGLDENGGIYHELYGEWWDGKIGYSRLDIELSAFIRGLTPGEGGMGKYEHLRECIDLLWNTGGKNVVEWNPWLEKMLEESCEHNFLAVAGCSSSSKSFGGAIIAIVNFIADPENTLVLVTSTSIGAAKRRIWKSVMQLWNKLPDKYKRLGKVKPSLNMIHYQPQDGSVAHDAASICLVAAEQKQEASAVQKLVGLKNERVILIADELCELSPAVLHASDNLISNPWFQMIAMSNPKDREDPFGLMCEPVEGWATLDESMMEWDTKYGKAIRFDVLQSPNYLEQEVIYKYMLTYEKIEKFRQQHGENSARFYRFYRGFFPVQGTEDTIYTDTDFNAYMQESVKWKKEPTKIAGLDLSFSSGGDKTSLCICLFGETIDGVMCLQLEKFYAIHENAADKMNPRTDQICAEVKKILDKEGVSYRNLAVDSTSATGTVDRLTQFMSKEILRINFGGRATERPVSSNDRTPSSKKYTNRVSELWGVGIEFMRGGQLSGFRKDPELCHEMKARRFSMVKGADGERMMVEPKLKMKLRIGRSPDKADSLMLCIETCRERFHWQSKERGLSVLPKKDFFEVMRRLDVVSRSNGGGDWMAIA
jgi:hypothetical protein